MRTEKPVQRTLVPMDQAHRAHEVVPPICCRSPMPGVSVTGSTTQLDPQREAVTVARIIRDAAREIRRDPLEWAVLAVIYVATLPLAVAAFWQGRRRQR
jgi:hypothetical protein